MTRTSSDAHDNPAMRLDAWLDGHRRWPCLNPQCRNKVDPDSAMQYCSPTCRNAVASGRVPNMDKQKLAAARIRDTARYWVRNVRHLDADIRWHRGL